MHPQPSTTPRLLLARWVSLVAHPFVTALVLVATVELDRGAVAAARTAAVVGVLFVLPLAALTALQVRRGAWSTVDASRSRERPALFGVGAAGLAAVLAYFAWVEAEPRLLPGALAILAMVGVCAAVTPWLKVSLHMAAAGLAAAVLLGRGLAIGWLFGAALPVLAWSRVALGRHRWSEVVAGTVIGAVTGAVVARLG